MDSADSRMKSVAKSMGKAGVAGAALGLAGALKIGVGEFMEAQRVTAQTNAVLKSTGGVANVSTKAIQDLANSLMRKSGVDDEAIQSGQNMLLTFTKIRNETGKGNDVFNQATKATLDLSVAMGKDMQSSAVLVGKALNDPIKGIGALSRVGVQLSGTQKDLIKDMVASGNTMGAQKVILSELETQFGGSAVAAGKTFGGQINIAKETLTNFAGQGVAALVPHLTSLATWFGDTIVPKVKGFIRALTGSESLKVAFAAVGDFIKDTWLPTIKSIATVFGNVFAAVLRVLNDKKPEIEKIITGIKAVLEGVYLVVQNVIVPALKLVFAKGGPFDVAFGLAIDIVSGVVTAVGKIVGGVRSAVDGVKAFWSGQGGKTFRGVFDAMAAVVQPIADAFGKIVDSVKWLIENIRKIPKPSLPSLPDLNPFGDAHDPRKGIGFDLLGASPVMAPFAAAAAGFGLRVTSGLRPGAITANGTPSDHGVGKALDLVGSTQAMGAYFRSLVGNRAVKQAFFDPLGSIFGGAWSSYREGGHSDHVHVATYDQGGVLKPGLTLAYNGTGRDEYVHRGGQPILLQINLDGQSFARAIFDPLKSENTRQGRLGRGL